MPSRLMTVPEDKEMQMPEASPAAPPQQAPWRGVAAAAATFVTLLVVLGACTVAVSRASVVQTKSTLRKPVSLAVDEDVETKLKSETSLPPIYTSVPVRTDEDTSFHTWAVTEGHAVEAGDTILIGETSDGKKVAVTSGSSGIVMSLLDSVVDGDVIQRGTAVATIAHPTTWPMGGVLVLLTISSIGVLIICCGIAFTDPEDLLNRKQRPTKKMKKKKGTFAQEAALLAQRAAAAGSQRQQGYRALPAMGKGADDELPGLPKIAQAASQIV